MVILLNNWILLFCNIVFVSYVFASAYEILDFSCLLIIFFFFLNKEKENSSLQQVVADYESKVSVATVCISSNVEKMDVTAHI